MNLLTQRDVIAHQALVPWPNRRQVEQDLLLCQAMVALFNDDFLKGQIAMRGGTLLHKVHLAPASRYSEDIDLVVVGDRPKEHIEKALRRVLSDVLGKPAASVWGAVRLAVRNALRPSEILRLTYRLDCVSEHGSEPLEIVVEANVTERTPHREIVRVPFAHSFRGQDASVAVNAFDIHEMLGTKMRAMFQRRRGRDLFDLYWALTHAPKPVDPHGIIESFRHYMDQEGAVAGREEFVGILRGHLRDPGFLTDMDALLRVGIQYDPMEAADFVTEHLLNRLPIGGEGRG
ncbi:MAG: nucleotidyl transferase AbiEii/AbiGii toxin family protein [Betaproteobacteria bacterium]|nr:nucleotidyl transferase AbiEii/AbiGii toxin family protein [Betaproteobacteria bacterium]